MKKKTSICLSLFITCAFAISSLLPLSTIWTTAKAESLSNINPDSGQPEIFVGDLGEFFNASSDISLSDALYLILSQRLAQQTLTIIISLVIIIVTNR